MNYYAKLVEEKKNSKEEKTNDMFTYLGKRFAVTKGSYEHVRKEVEQTYKDKIAELERKAQTATGSEKSKIESDIRDIKSGWRETLANLRMMVENSKGYYAELIEKKNEMLRPNMFILDGKSFNIADVSGYRAAARAIEEKAKEMKKHAQNDYDIEFADKWQKEMGERLLKASKRDR